MHFEMRTKVNVKAFLFSDKRRSLDLECQRDALINQNNVMPLDVGDRSKNNREIVHKIAQNSSSIDDRNDKKYHNHSIVQERSENMMMTKPIIRLNDCYGFRGGNKLFEETVLNSLTITTNICGLERVARNNSSCSKPNSKKVSQPQTNFEGCLTDKVKLKKSASLNDIFYQLSYNRNVLFFDCSSNGAIINSFHISAPNQNN